MKKTYLLILMLFVSMVTMAGPITPEQARQQITKAMSPRRSAAALQDLRLVATGHYQERANVMAPCFYVFNAGKNQGYIIAGADDRIPAVLGYSNSGTFDPQNVPANMQAWLQSYSDQMEYLNRHPEAAAPQNTVIGEPISPLIQTHWDQGSPYNDLCPIDEGARSLTGCVATAMAQVMYFWKHPAATTEVIPGYTTETKGLTVAEIPAGTAIDWDNMQLKYSGSESSVQKTAVANLMLLCGTAVYMNYTSKGSGTWGGYVGQALLQYFDYDQATKYEERLGYRTAEWNQKVYDELKAGRPLYYDGASSGSGHAFVIDGYGGDDYFHVNWGWGGSSDNYFLLSILDPDNNSGAGATSSSDGYSFDQGAIFGAQPNTGVPPTVIPILTTQSAALPDGTEFTRTDVSENFTFRVGFSCYNGLDDTYTFDWGVGLFDTNDQLFMYPNYYCTELKPRYGFWDAEQVAITFYFGSNMTNGTYLIKPISRENGTEQWYADKGSDNYAVIATIKDNTLTLMPPTFGLIGSLEATGKKEVGRLLPVDVTIINNGTLFNDQIFLFLNGELVGGRHFDIDAGQTDVVNFTIVPKTEGVNELSVCTRSWNGDTQQWVYTPFITGSVTIEAATEATLTMTPKTKNANYDKEIGRYVVKEDKAIVSIDVNNIGSTDYDNDVIVRLYKMKNETSGGSAGIFRKNIQLAKGASTTVELELTNLEDGGRYFYYVYYMSNGQEVEGNAYSQSFVVQIPGVEPMETCATPTIQVVDGKLKFSCETEDVTYKVNYQLDSADATVAGDETALGGTTTCLVTVIATKEGYNNSEAATAEVKIAWGKRGDVNTDGEVNVGDIVTVTNIMAGKDE